MSSSRLFSPELAQSPIGGTLRDMAAVSRMAAIAYQERFDSRRNLGR